MGPCNVQDERYITLVLKKVKLAASTTILSTLLRVRAAEKGRIFFLRCWVWWGGGNNRRFHVFIEQ